MHFRKERHLGERREVDLFVGERAGRIETTTSGAKPVCVVVQGERDTWSHTECHILAVQLGSEASGRTVQVVGGRRPDVEDLRGYCAASIIDSALVEVFIKADVPDTTQPLPL